MPVSLDGRLGVLEGRMQGMEQRFNSVDDRFDGIDEKQDQILRAIYDLQQSKWTWSGSLKALGWLAGSSGMGACVAIIGQKMLKVLT